MVAGPVALPHRGDPTPVEYPQAGPGQTGPWRRRSTAVTHQIPVPLGPLQGGGQAQRAPDVPISGPGSDFHCIDPYMPKTVALPRRGLYGNDTHPQGPFAPGGNRGSLPHVALGGNFRRAEVITLLPGAASPSMGGNPVGGPLSKASPPSEFSPARPYFQNRWSAERVQPPTTYSWQALGIYSRGPGGDGGKTDRRRLDQWMWRQMYGNSSQRYLPPTRGRFQRYGTRWLAKSDQHPQMVAGPGHANQLAMLPAAQSFGQQSQQLQTSPTEPLGTGSPWFSGALFPPAAGA